MEHSTKTAHKWYYRKRLIPHPFLLSSSRYLSQSQAMFISKGIIKYCYIFYNTTQETTSKNNSDFYNKVHMCLEHIRASDITLSQTTEEHYVYAMICSRSRNITEAIG